MNIQKYVVPVLACAILIPVCSLAGMVLINETGKITHRWDERGIQQQELLKRLEAVEQDVRMLDETQRWHTDTIMQEEFPFIRGELREMRDRLPAPSCFCSQYERVLREP